MNLDFFEKNKNDDTWKEIIKLYSGLFNDENERTEFVIDLSDFNASLAADCKNESIDEELVVTEILKQNSYKKAIYFKDFKASANAFEALLKLGGQKEVLDVLGKIETPNLQHKQLLHEFVLKSSKDELIIFLANIIKNDAGNNKNILNWIFKTLTIRRQEDIPLEDEINYLAIIDNLKRINNRSEKMIAFCIGVFLSIFKLSNIQHIVKDICIILYNKRAVDESQYQVVQKLMNYYELPPDFMGSTINDLDNRHKILERERIEKSDEIKKSILNSVVSCRLCKLKKVSEKKLTFIEVVILGIQSAPRGKQLISISDFKNYTNYKTGDIINAKVIKIRLGQGDIFLRPI